MKNNIIKYIKRWNWLLYFVVLSYALLGIIVHEIYKIRVDLLIFVLIGVNLLGLLIAWITKD